MKNKKSKNTEKSIRIRKFVKFFERSNISFQDIIDEYLRVSKVYKKDLK